MSHKIGAHVSAAGGVQNAIERAATIGANCVQVFSGSPRVWAKPKLESVQVEKLQKNQSKFRVDPVFTHALYLVNLGSDNPELVNKSLASLKYELEFDALIGGAGVIAHLGSHQGRGWDAIKDQVVAQLVKLLNQTPTNSRLLIENAASRNGKIGGDLAEIKYLIDAIDEQYAGDDQKRLGWCFDTCHAFAAGYNLSQVWAEIEKLNLAGRLYCVHVNDSRDPAGSNRDRHANLGDGYLDQSQLKQFLTLPQLNQTPFIIEVPGLENEGPDKANIDRLKKILGEK